MTATRTRRTAHGRNTTPDGPIIDLFAGPGGWSQALRSLGLADVGIELDPAACATRQAAGHATVRADVAALPVAHLAGKLTGLIGSPPCQGMSTAGLRAGWTDLDVIGSLLTDLAKGRDTRAAYAVKVADPRSQLIAEPLRYALAAMPEWVACEQVPAVLPLWREAARHLEAVGYSTWCGILNAADYGLPQTRRRAFLIASRTRRVHRPEPTHARASDAPDMLFGTPRKAWVSMADALGWAHPATVNVRGHHTGGGSEFTTDRPAQALTHSTRSWTLHTNRGQRPDGTRQMLDPATTPAPTLTGKSGDQWVLRSGSRAHATTRQTAEPASTLVFGHHLNDVSWIADDGARRRLSIPDASLLQGFPTDYPWQGSRTKAFEQIGNAVPPPLARAVLTVATGIEAAA